MGAAGYAFHITYAPNFTLKLINQSNVSKVNWDSLGYATRIRLCCLLGDKIVKLCASKFLLVNNVFNFFISSQHLFILNIFLDPAWGGKCSNGGIVPNTACIFRAFAAAPRTQSYLCIFSSFYLALNLKLPGGE